MPLNPLLLKKFFLERPVDVVNSSTFAVIDQGAMDKTSTMASGKKNIGRKVIIYSYILWKEKHR